MSEDRVRVSSEIVSEAFLSPPVMSSVLQRKSGMQSDTVYEVAISIFKQASEFTNLFVLPLALIRIAWANVSGSGSSEYSSVFKGVVLYFVLIFGFEPVLKLILDLPEAFGIGERVMRAGGSEVRAQSLSVLPDVLSWSMESVASGLYYIAVFLNFAFTVVLTSLAPVIFLLGAVMGLGLGLRLFFGLLIMVSSWPIVWQACDAIFQAVSPQATSQLAIIVFEIVCLLLKITGPLALSYFGAHSSPVGQALARTTGFIGSTTTVVQHNATSFVQGARGASSRVNQRTYSTSQHVHRAALAGSHRLGRGLHKMRSKGRKA